MTSSNLVTVRRWVLMLAVLAVVLAVLIWPLARVLFPVLAVFALAAEASRFVMLPAPAKRYYLPARWHRLTWRRLARNLSLAYRDRHLGGLDSRRQPAIVYPRARFLPDPHGWTVRLRLIPGITRAEVEKAAPSLADAWGCHRVGITQPRPGRLTLRAMRIDPLADPLPADVLAPFDGRRVLLGKDEFGQLRHVSLANLSGSVMGGNPGRGKSAGAASIAVQFAQVPSTAWYVLDGGGGADWSHWSDRAVRFAADDLAEARDVIEDAHARMAARLRTLTDDLGTRNAWTVGPSSAYPLVWVLLDEAHQYLDIESAKAVGKEAEQNVRAIRALTANMLRRGRKVLYHVSLLAQKATSSSIPPDLRDLAGLRACFGVATTEAAVAVLGDDVRAVPSLSPTQLQGDGHAGVATVRLATGADIYTRIRFPFVDEDLADDYARRTAHFGSPVPVCVACVGQADSCQRCKGTGLDPDPAAPVLVA